MVIRVLNDRSVVKDTDPYGTQNENQVTTLNFVIPEEYTSFNKKIVFITSDGVYWDLITNDTYIIKNNVTKYRNVSAYVWLVDVENQIDFRTKIFYIDFNQNTNPDNYIPSEEQISGFDTMIAELNELIDEVEDLGALHYEIVEELPTEDIDSTAVYLILREDSEPNNIYDEWMYIEEEWEKIGSTDVDLEPLQKEIDEINEMLFTHTTAESVNQEVSLNGNPNLEMNVTELDGRTEQDSTTGKQLFNKNATPIITNNLPITVLPTGVRVANIQDNTSYVFCNYKIMDLTDYVGKTVRAKANFTTSGSNNTKYYIGLCDENGNNRVQKANGNVSGDTISFEVTEMSGSVKYLCIVLYANNGGNAHRGDYADFTDLIITINNSDMSYEPYTNGASPNPDYKQDIHVVTGTQEVVVRGKNLFDKTQVTHTVLQADGTATDTSGAFYTSDFIKIKSLKQYTKTITGSVRIKLYDSNKTAISTSSYSDIASFGDAQTFSIPYSNAKYIRYTVAEENINSMMLVEGTTLGDYEPYRTPITKQLSLGSKELFEDSFIDRDSNGDWYFNDNYLKELFKNMEIERATTNTSGKYRFKFTPTIQAKATSSTSDIADIYSNIASKESANATYSCENGLAIATTGNIFIYRDEFSAYNTQTMTEYYSTSNDYVVYPLAETIRTKITDETLISQLNAIQKLQQFNGTTIVEIQGNLPADFKLVYENDSISDLNTRVASLESGKLDKTAIVSSVSSSSTNNQVPGAKLFYDTIGDINTMLDQMNREVI